ncbi:hypothetical protein [Kitasatospora sp. HPMI-4]|uniref:hypothetical protein n=1 Tax=Kitasatospora sp. HPMI-4 TaxID=3448443 RepID=UPI003F1CFA6D
MNTEPIPTERLDAIRRMDLATLIPQSQQWRPATQAQARRWLQLMAPVLHELLDEIVAQDADLDEAEAEIAELRATSQAPTLPPVDPGTSITLRRLASGRWQLRWYSDNKRRSKAVGSRPAAERLRAVLYDRARNGGGR